MSAVIMCVARVGGDESQRIADYIAAYERRTGRA